MRALIALGFRSDYSIKTILQICFWCIGSLTIWGGVPCPYAQASEGVLNIGWNKIPLLPGKTEFSSAAYAIVGDSLIYIGHSKDDAWRRQISDDNWQRVGLQDSPACDSLFSLLASGAALQNLGDSALCCGGVSAQVVLLRDDSDGIQLELLPDLPSRIERGLAVMESTTLYLLGQTNEKNWQGWQCSFTMESPAWQDWACSEVLEGRPKELIKQSGKLLLLQEDSQSLFHFDTKSFLWQRLESLPVTLSSLAACQVGPSHVWVTEATAPGREFYYHTITDTWRPINLLRDTKQNFTVRRAEQTNGRLILFGDGVALAGELKRATSGLKRFDLIALGAYALLLIGISAYFSRHDANCEDYFLAGRKIPWWAAGMSLLGGSISAITFMAFPAMSFRTNWVYLLGNFMILPVAPVVIRYYLPFYRQLNLTSAYEYLELRFGLIARMVGSTTYIAFQLGRMGVILYLPSLALSAVSNWDINFCIVAIGIIATAYTTLGGIEAVIWTDVIQVIVLIGGAIVTLTVINQEVPGGLEEIARNSWQAGKLHAVNFTWDMTATGIGIVLIGNFFKFLIPYSSDQTVVQRYLTTRDETQAARGIWLNALASLPVWTLFFAIGTALWGYYQLKPEALDPIGRTDEVFAWFIIHELPPGFAGLVLAGLFAACMSSLDSSLNSTATAITTDFYCRFRPDVSSEKALRVARKLTLLLGVLGTATAIWLAWQNTQSIWDQFLKIMGLLGGGLAGMFVAGIFTKRVMEAGVLIGFVGSGLILICVSTFGIVHFFLYGAIGIISCLIISWTISCFLSHDEKGLQGLTIFSLDRSG
ncbi:sodium:solute symporter [Calycomorphotria hydatis]|uniref:Sodium/glucose cotransporter n=1 Tax=Calycomorphotria hydatis TaxID=2528027 RepID=A0A517TA56_9PLAN|nr:sodium:solute symporter [Calycomorphotria hydatis]QDT65260.1 Sodium/glucose cotransporter [Calycomorphotria hydatis]